ncbi:MAG: hypothetical protein ABFC80_09490 [Coriobacteriales bacterium]|nr:hypothetical protein [Actinomycetes bacterium]
MAENESAPAAPEKRRGVRPRELATLMALVIVVALAGVWWFVSREDGAADLLPPPVNSESPVSYAGQFPSPDRPRLLNPLGLALGEDRLYVAESDASRIAVFRLDGKELGTIAVPVASGAATAYPVDVSIVDTSTIAVVDTAGQRVLLLPADPGASAHAVVVGDSTARTAPIQPTAVTAHGDEVFVADGVSHDIKVYDSTGAYLRTIGRALRPALTFVGGMCVLGDALYVTDSNSGRVLVLDRVSGVRRSSFPDERALPRGIAPGPYDGLLVVDTFGRTIDIVARSGAGIVSITDESAAQGGGLKSPRDVAWDPAVGRAYVTDASRGLVVVFNIVESAP